MHLDRRLMIKKVKLYLTKQAQPKKKLNNNLNNNLYI